MFQEYLFAVITRLLSSRWIRNCRQYHTAAPVPPGLEINDCFVLAHRDAYLALRLGRIEFGYRVCLGEETVRSSGFYWYYER